ncbi:MAG: septation ring formation regulator EzrA, partial [Erysipelotrichaceae bacterium]
MERLITLLENVAVLIEQYMDLQIALLLLGGFVALLFGVMIFKSAQTKKLKRQLNEAENRFNEIKSTPLLFKLNKAVALARVNENVNQAIDACKGDFEHVQENLKLCSAMLGDIDDLIFVHKRKAARRAYLELNELLHELEVSARNVNLALDEVLQQENIQREQINVQKEEYRNLKKAFLKDALLYNDAYTTIEGRLANIETMFSSFEEWMFASEFNKASEQQRAIIDELSVLQSLYEQLPLLFEKAKGVLPALLENTSFEYLNARNKGVRLDQYDISEQLELVTSLLQEDLSKLRNCEIKGVKDHLEDAEVRLNQINDAIHKENRLYEEVHNNIDGLDGDIQTLLLQIEKLKGTYARVFERFGFENWEVRLVDLDSNMEDLRNNRNTINELILESKTPYNRIHAHFSEVELQLRQLEKEVSTMLEQLESACADESRAKKQLVKLQVILNDIKISIHKQHLPSVSIK